MSMYPKDLGKILILDVKDEIDLTEATKMEIHVFIPTPVEAADKPECPSECDCDLILTATRVGTTQQITATLDAATMGDLEFEAGQYIAQAYVEGTAFRHHGAPYVFTIKPFKT